MKKITYVSLLLWLVGWSGAWAQDPQFSQFYSNQVMINPAFTGAAQGPRVAMNYRRQWSAIPGYYRTYAFAYDQPVNFGKTRHGLGLSFMADQAGEGNLTKLDVNLCYSYQLNINDNNVVRFGLAGGIQQASVDFFKLRFGDQINPVSGFVNPTAEANIGESRIIESVNAGVVYYNKYIYAGFTANHITQPEQRFYSTVLANADPKLPMRMTAFAGANIPFGEKTYNKEGKSISPALLFRQQGPFTQIDVGMYVNLDPIVLGVWYRNQDAIIGLIGVRKGMMSFGYSYDYTISKLRNSVTGGSHEVSLVLEFEKASRYSKLKHRNLPCPRF